MALQIPHKRIPEILEGATIEVVEVNDWGSVVIYGPGWRLYADRPALYTNESDDVPAVV